MPPVWPKAPEKVTLPVLLILMVNAPDPAVGAETLTPILLFALSTKPEAPTFTVPVLILSVLRPF